MSSENIGGGFLNSDRIIALGSILVAMFTLLFSHFQHRATLEHHTEQLRLQKELIGNEYDLKLMQLLSKTVKPSEFRRMMAIGDALYYNQEWWSRLKNLLKE